MMVLRSTIQRETCIPPLSPMKLVQRQIGIRQFVQSSIMLDEKKTNQQERAIRVKNQQRALMKKLKEDGKHDVIQTGAPRKSSFRKQSRTSSFEGERGNQNSAYSVRDHRYRVANQLMDLFYKKIPATEAFQTAKELVEKMPPFSRRSTYIYNAYIRHAARAGKGNGALSIFQDMKKNGIAPNLETYRSIFMGMSTIDIKGGRDTKLVASLRKTFEEFENFWYDAIRFKQGIRSPIAAEEDVDEDLESVLDKEMDGKNKQETQYTNTTHQSFKLSRTKGYEEALTSPTHFCQTVNSYLQLLLRIARVEEAARLVLRSPQLDKPLWSKGENGFAPGLMTTLSKTFLEFQEDRKDVGNREIDKPNHVWSKALKFSQVAVKDVKGLNAFKDHEIEKESRRWKSMQNSGKLSLALTKAEMRELFDDDSDAEDGPPASRMKTL